MIDFISKTNYGMDDLLHIMSLLREQCPWDREQTHESIRMNLLEEAYEAAEAISERDDSMLSEELGDVLLQVVFHSQIASETGRFDFSVVADGICRKLIERHPHVFAELEVSGTEEVLGNWDAIKRKNKTHTTQSETMEALCKCLPALMRAEKIQKRAAKVGFDWPDISGARDKLSEEIRELDESIECLGNIEEELGDLLFSVVNMGRFLQVDCERALEKANKKFISRFSRMERIAAERGQCLEALSLETLENLWTEIKDV